MKKEHKKRSFIGRYLEREAAGGIILMICALVGFLMANTPLHDVYQAILHIEVAGYSAAHFINDGLMAVFFLVVGLELKRELLKGELSSRKKAMLPAIAALGGMAVPCLIYAAFNYNDPEFLRGWAIPAATDIAFALGVLALLGKRVPASLKLFLMALAVIDDLGSVLIIGLFYTSGLNIAALGVALLIALLAYISGRAGMKSMAYYMLLFIPLWFAVTASGLHATLAGVLLAFMVPIGAVQHIEHKLHPYVAFFILPVFAFANAGVPVLGMSLGDLSSPLVLGVVLGLLLGKPIGIVGASWLAVKARLCALPSGVRWSHMIGVGVLGGIGFTMSLFITAMAFNGGAQDSLARMGVLLASCAAAALGFAILKTKSVRG